MSATRLGPLLVLAYCVVNGAKSVFEGALVHRLSPEFLAFNAFLCAQLWFLWLCRDRRSLLVAVRRSLGDVVAYNIATAVSWLAVLYAFTELEPAVTNSLVVGLVPVGTMALGTRMRAGTRVLPGEKAAAAGLLASMAVLAALAWHDRGGGGSMSGFAVGLAGCVLTAVAVACCTHCTKRLAEAGMSVSEMMATRFVLLLLACPVLMWARDGYGTYRDGGLVLWSLVNGVAVIVALYLLQQGIVRTEPLTVSFLLAANLVVTYAFQFLDPSLDQSWPTFAAVLAVTAFVVLGVRARTGTSARRSGAA
ncbi:EamA/RhaT family transporter [Streptomyces sp. NPDC002536]